MPDKRKDPILAMSENIRYLRSQNASKEDIEAEIARWQPIIARYNAAEQAQAEREEKLGSIGTRAATALGQPLRALPGGERLMAAVRAGARGQSYEEALGDIQTAQESINPVAGAAIRAATGMATFGPVLGRIAPAASVAGGAAQAAGTGAILSAAERALAAQSEPLAERAAGTARAARTGAMVGAGMQAGARGLVGGRDVARSLFVPSRGAQQKAAEAALATTTGPMYTAAEQAGAVTQGPVRAFGEPGIREYVDDILRSPSFREKYPNPSQQDVLKYVREHILDVQKAAEKAAMGQAASGTQRVAAATKLQKADAETLARQLLDESDYFTQGLYRQAVTTTAQGKAAQRAAQAAGEATRRSALRSWVPGSKLGRESREAFVTDVGRMSPQEVKAALPASYAGLRESINLTYNPIAGFGLPQSATRVIQARPVIEALERASTATQAPGLYQSFKGIQPKTIRDYLLSAGTGY
jgi:hypothetical protein